MMNESFEVEEKEMTPKDYVLQMIYDMLSNKRTFEANCILRIFRELHFSKWKNFLKIIFFFKKKLPRFYGKKWLFAYSLSFILRKWTHINFSKMKINENVVFLSQLNLSSVEYFNLYRNTIYDEELTKLAVSDYDNLSTLILAENRLSDLGIKSFFEVKILKNLRVLDLNHNHLTAQAMLSLSKANMYNLTNFNISHNNIGPLGMKYFQEANFKELVMLDLSYNNIKDAGMVYWKDIPVNNLRYLNLGRNKIRAEGMSNIIQAKFPQLETLDLMGNDLGIEGCIYVRDLHIPTLTSLNIRANQIGDEGVRIISNGHPYSLQDLNMSFNGITQMGEIYLNLGTMRDIPRIAL